MASELSRRRVAWDMETGDPDDFLTLLLLLDHPWVDLVAVTVTPGTPEQVGLVRRALEWFGRGDLPVGAHDLTHGKQCVSGWHEDTFGPWPPSHDAAPGHEVLRAVCDADTTLVTGAPPKNLGAALEREGLRLGRWVAQGGFAGEGVVPPERQLAKFKGLRACPSYNFNGAPKAVLEALASPAIGERRLVSKNVCHGVNYDDDLHARLGAVKGRRQSLGLIWDAMQRYLTRRPAGKLFHDPLAACCALDAQIGTWAEVRVLRERGEWAAEPQAGSNTWIITGYDHELFVRALLGEQEDEHRRGAHGWNSGAR